ncbi:putative MFS family arabinose efflux permease [Antricoccus suffuscus]|uniref:Putative MFS family arabinose efflux permease n=1 Tax=Antricoccus suffuscus TaxID=1629062 RepID=A0A2T1A388_9ACTN|nr:MFS transporter [Antricoccus suffuscus]PRZ43063.1 putative MFS family arabinose efflux permease [Antricoccus suffuscus]
MSLNEPPIDSTSTSPRSPSTAPFPWVGLIALASAVFLSVTSEMVPTGLLPDMSRSLEVTEAQIGLLVTYFAVTVVVTSTPLTALTRRVSRHAMVVAVLVVLAISNALTAIAPNYEFVVASRVLGGLAHGLFWSIVGAYAGHLVPKAQIGRAVSVALSGGSIAFVLGIPIGTGAGHAFGWRLTFVGLGVLMLIGAVVIWYFLPAVDRAEPVRRTAAADGTRARRDTSIVPVLLVCTITALIMIGHYSFYTYIAPFLIDEFGVSEGAIGPLLFGYGIAGVVGLILAGSVLGRRPQLGLILAMVVTGVAVAATSLLTGVFVLGIGAFLVWGAAFGALPPLMQTRLLHTASASFRDTASAVYTTAFNIGIGGGALVGAIVFDAFGVARLPWVYVGVVVVALVLAVRTDQITRRRELSSAL